MCHCALARSIAGETPAIPKSAGSLAILALLFRGWDRRDPYKNGQRIYLCPSRVRSSGFSLDAFLCSTLGWVTEYGQLHFSAAKFHGFARTWCPDVNLPTFNRAARVRHQIFATPGSRLESHPRTKRQNPRICSNDSLANISATRRPAAQAISGRHVVLALAGRVRSRRFRSNRVVRWLTDAVYRSDLFAH